MDGTRGGRRLDRIITAFFNEVERRNRCRERIEQLTAEWSGAIPDALPDDARSEAERRIKSTGDAPSDARVQASFLEEPSGPDQGARRTWQEHGNSDRVSRPERSMAMPYPRLRARPAPRRGLQEGGGRADRPGHDPQGPSPRAVVMYGRTRGMETGTARCLRPELAAAVEGKVGSTYQAICCNDTAECPLITRCRLTGYLAQYEDRAPALRIFPHAHLGIEQPEDLRLPKPDLVIIDEGCIDALREQLEVPLDWLADPRVYGRPQTLAAREHAFIGSRVAEAIREHGLSWPACGKLG